MLRATRLFILAGLVTLTATSASSSTNHYGLTISTAATYNVSLNNGVFTATGDHAVLNVNDLENALASGDTEVTTDSGSGGDEKGDLHVEAALSWKSLTALTLYAYRSIFVDQPVSNDGAGGMVIVTNNGALVGSGTLSFGPKGHITFANLSSSLSISGKQYALVNTIAALAKRVRAGARGALATNYDASQDGTYSEAPIPTPLNSIVEGLGNTISNLSIDPKTHRFDVGLFSDVMSGSIRNLRLSHVSILYVGTKSGFARNVGALVGENYYGFLAGDEVRGSIQVKRCAGCPVGGLVGWNMDGTVSNSSTRVNVNAGATSVGGLVGFNESTITLSHADGTVGGSVSESGGLIGVQSFGTVSQSYATGKVNGGVGGVAGGLVGGAVASATIQDSYSTATIGGPGGGFIGDAAHAGRSQPMIETSYSTGPVPSGSGGFACAVNKSVLSNDYWDTTTSGESDGLCSGGNAPGITGLTTKQLQSGLPDGFDPNIWAQDANINSGLPYLKANPPPK